MRRLVNLRLRFKLLLLNGLVYALTLVVACSIWVFMNYQSNLDAFEHRINTQARVIAGSLEAALVFDDTEAIDEALFALGEDIAVTYARVFDLNDRFIAEQTFTSIQPSVNNLLSAILGSDLYSTEAPIYLNNQRIGALFLSANNAEVLKATQITIVSIFLVLFLALLSSTLISARGLKWLLGPVEKLSLLASTVKNTKNYSLRAKIELPDEVGKLADEFNAMLTMIEERDQFLENEVVTRTKELAHQATHDILTKLPNRRGLQSHLEEVISSSEGVRHALLILDLDQFKIINDTCGHSGGDQMLIELSEKLKSEMYAGDYLARLGGDEFAAVLYDVDEISMKARADRILTGVEQFHFHWEGLSFNVRVSIGALLFYPNDVDVKTLLKKADVACFTAKDLGRNRTYSITDESNQLTKRHTEMGLVQKINNAIAYDHFVLYQQPIVSLNSSESSQEYEILLRLKEVNSEKILLPEDFLSAAARYGLATNIDRWVVSRTIEHIKSRFSTQESPSTYWINLNTLSICDQKFVEFLEETLIKAALPHGTLVFEIVETGFIEALDIVAENIRLIQKLGGRFALDDFGSGASSFKYLQELPLNYLKIDGSFIRNLLSSETDFAVTRSIIEIAKAIDLKVVAEHVESTQLLELVGNLGADYAQGWAVGYPEIVPLV